MSEIWKSRLMSDKHDVWTGWYLQLQSESEQVGSMEPWCFFCFFKDASGMALGKICFNHLGSPKSDEGFGNV